jgi:hypothetical protein
MHTGDRRSACPGAGRLARAAAWVLALAAAGAAAQSGPFTFQPTPPKTAAELKLSADLRLVAQGGSAPGHGAPGAGWASGGGSSRLVKVIVSANLPSDPNLLALRNWIRSSPDGKKGAVHYRYAAFQGLSVVIPADRLLQLAAQPGVRYVVPNRAAHRSQLSYQSLGHTTGRVEAGVANAGLTGAGIGIAVLDSGIDFRHASLPDLSTGRKVAGRVDFVSLRKGNGNAWALGQDLSDKARAVVEITPDKKGGPTDLTHPGRLAPWNWGNKAPSNPDPYGHGTHVAAVAAGSAVQGAVLSGGLAPGARLYDVRVLDDNGVGELADVLAGIDWVLQRARHPAYNIRVMNLSLGMSSMDSFLVDPLARAARGAVAAGITVVAAAGNLG